ncbi:MAG TPA: tetratricopeptide repeat protein [Polyangiaceae bacterium]|nr:tetratricopeptide repeat protein [Polyangiaceae bacterium]
MAENSDDLERLSREQLILKARVLGVERPELMTRVELRDEIVRCSEPDIAQQKRARGFLGVARDLVASVVEAGLNLPDAAALIRGDANRETHWKGPPPVATVTLAEIYATQGHLDRALRMLDEVLAKEPDHDAARALRTRLATATDLPASPARRRQKISFAENSPFNAPAPAEPSVVSESDPTTAPEPEATINFAPSPPVAPEPEATLDFSPAPEPEPVVAPPPEAEPVVVSAQEAEPVAASAPETEQIVEPEPIAAPEHEPELQVTAAHIEPTPSDVPPHTEPVAAAPDEVPLAVEPESIAPAPAPAPASLLTLSVAGQRQIYWELPAESLSALRAHAPSGRPVVRVITFRTRAGRVERHSNDLTPDSEVGFAVLPNLRADAVVRAVLGWQTEGRFMPYLVASDLPSGIPSGRRNGPFRANSLVGAVAHEVEQRALSHCSRRPAH